MKDFPKKYKAQELHERSKKYKEINNYKITDNDIFSVGNISVSKKISYQDFFYFYVRDFFNLINNRDSEKNSYQNLFLTSSNQLKNICFGYNFFNKKKQNLDQVGINKFERYMISNSQKNIKANNKIIENYLSSPYKIYIPDSDLYLYILKIFQALRKNGKILCEKKIGYRSFKLQTSIPSEYILRKEEIKPFYILKYFVGTKCETLPIYIEDIDLCCGDVALLVHPKDKRYNKYIGKNAIIPLCNRQIPIIGDENVNITLNNGIQRICPCADQESIKLAEKYGLPTDIYVFDKKGLYTDYIHESAFIGKERNKYYHNIEGFINDIGNLDTKGEKLVKIPYLNYLEERLVPYNIEQIELDITEEKESIINKIFNNDIKFSFLSDEFGDTLNQINLLESELRTLTKGFEGEDDINDNFNTKTIDLQEQISELKQKIIKKIDKYLPNYLICNNQLSYGRRIPLIKYNNGDFSFFDIEKDYIKEDEDSVQFCFDFIILSLIRLGIIGNKKELTKNNKIKLCEYEKLPRILSENEKKIGYFINYLSESKGDKSEYQKVLKIIHNITDTENSSINDCLKLIKECKLLQKDGNWLLINLTGLSNDIIDYDFIQACIPCYLHDKNIKINNDVIFNKKEKGKIFKEMLIQELLLGNTISKNFKEFSYNKDEEFLGDNQLTKLQIEQSQRDLFKLYGESPIRLNFLVNQAYNQKEILLNNFFLKQIWNATRLCIQKDFIPKDIKETLNKQPEYLEDLDILFLYHLNNIYDSRKEIETYEQYIKFFISFKGLIQDLFFSRYLEVQKIKPSKNVQFICCYFFNILLNIIHPLIPEFVDALQYISKREFLFKINKIQLNKSIDFNLHLIYDTFLKIKNIKIESNIKQHESCNVFIKSNPTICEIFSKYEQIFKNYFHISEICYLRLHEQTPLGYETFSNDTLTIGIQPGESTNNKGKDSLDNIEKEIKNLDDKLNLLKERLPLLEGVQRTKAEEEYAKTKDEIENLTIRYSLLSSK